MVFWYLLADTDTLVLFSAIMKNGANTQMYLYHQYTEADAK